MAVEVQLSAWEPLEGPDLASIGIATCTDTAAAILLAHVVINRKRHPYQVKMPTLVALTACSGIATTVAVAVRFGILGSPSGQTSAPLGCLGQAWLLWCAAGVLFSSGFLRVYRYHSVLARFRGDMWPAPAQLTVMMAPFLVPPVVLSARPDLAAFDATTQECELQLDGPEGFLLGCMVLLATVSAGLTFAIRTADKQAPEEISAAKGTSITLMVAVFIIPVVHSALEDDRSERRRAMLVIAALTSACLLALPLRDTIAAYISAADEDFDESEDLSTSKEGPEARAMQEDHAKVNALASGAAAADNARASEMASFYGESLDREAIQDHFLLQASTMCILDRYVREGGPMFVPFPIACRHSMLTSKASSRSIFSEARQEIMVMLGGGNTKESALATAAALPSQNTPIMGSFEESQTTNVGSTSTATPDTSANSQADAWASGEAPKKDPGPEFIEMASDAEPDSDSASILESDPGLGSGSSRESESGAESDPESSRRGRFNFSSRTISDAVSDIEQGRPRFAAPALDTEDTRKMPSRSQEVSSASGLARSTGEALLTSPHTPWQAIPAAKTAGTGGALRGTAKLFGRMATGGARVSSAQPSSSGKLPPVRMDVNRAFGLRSRSNSESDEDSREGPLDKEALPAPPLQSSLSQGENIGDKKAVAATGAVGAAEAAAAVATRKSLAKLRNMHDVMGLRQKARKGNGFADEQPKKESVDGLTDLEASSHGRRFVTNPLYGDAGISSQRKRPDCGS